MENSFSGAGLATPTTGTIQTVDGSDAGHERGSHPWRVRDYAPGDLDRVVQVWQDWNLAHEHPVYGLSDVIAACIDGVATVAVDGDLIVGAAAARIQGNRAWILMLAQDAAYRDRGVGSALLAAIESRLTAREVFDISALLPAAETRVKAFLNSDFGTGDELRYFERHIPVQADDVRPLAAVGGRLLPRGLWSALAGMHSEKEIIEQRLILPLAEADLADSLGVVPPKAVVLFGPPGTGKTTFARAIASRLAWPFVEVRPSQLAADSAGLASALREVFAQVALLKHAVVFIDEVEEIAAQRGGDPPAVGHGVTNELLKSIPSFREREGRLLICATNFVRSIDKAFLRHGRFDYVIPIGLPDLEARRSIWERYIPERATVHTDPLELAAATERFSPADIEFAARKASQSAFEEVIGGQVPRSAADALTTSRYLAAIADTRATVTEAMETEFREDIRQLARI